MSDITVDQLHEKMKGQEEFFLLDVREPVEYAEYNLGATNIPLGEIATRLDEIKIHAEKEIVVHCKLGGRSKAAQEYLVQQGFSKVVNVMGGADGYRAKFG